MTDKKTEFLKAEEAASELLRNITRLKAEIGGYAEAKKTSKKNMARLNDETKELLQKAGAHYVIDTIGGLPEIIDDINIRLARGERP